MRTGGGYSRRSTSLNPVCPPQSGEITISLSEKQVMMTLCIFTSISLHSVYVLATEGTSVRRLRLDLDPAKEAGTVKRQASSVASSRPLPSPTKSHISTTTAYPPYRNAMMDYEAISSPYELFHRCVWSLQTSGYVCRVRGRFDICLPILSPHGALRFKTCHQNVHRP